MPHLSPGPPQGQALDIHNLSPSSRTVRHNLHTRMERGQSLLLFCQMMLLSLALAQSQGEQHLVNGQSQASSQGFQLNFQMVKNKSRLTTSSYAEYTGEMTTSSTSTFTACFWFNIQYFSFSSNYIWQYCFIRNQEDLPVCTAFGK